jgi:hypothetical protein
VKAVNALLCNCVFSCTLYWLVSLPPLWDEEATSIFQWTHAGRAAVAPLVLLLVLLAWRSTTMFNDSSHDKGRFNRSTCLLTQLNFMFISLHQLSNRSCTVTIGSQSPFVLKHMLSVMGLFAANTADSLSHRNCTDHILMRPDLNVESTLTYHRLTRKLNLGCLN